MKENTNEVYVGKKELKIYIPSCFYALNKFGSVKIISRGSYIKKTIDILAILIRDYLENPEYLIKVKSESFDDRFISSIEIDLTGKRKEKEEN